MAETEQDNARDESAEPVTESQADSAAADAHDAELEKVRRERDQLFERLARLQADFQNSRRRLEGDIEQRLQFANAQLIKSLFPVMDNLERALSVDESKTDVAAMRKGMQITLDQWNKALASQSVTAIAPTPGTPFDPAIHEAIMEKPSDQYAEPTVVQLLQKGYQLHGRTLRPAQVAVSKLA
jgi:molecular chaperone GrpE